MGNFNINELVRPNVAKLSPYSSARDEFTNITKEMIFLDANENPFETSVNRYPDPQQRTLKRILAEKKQVSPENILLGNGSDEVLDLIFRAFCVPSKDTIITLPPTYGMYKVLAGINEVENREVLLTANFELPVSEIIAAQDLTTKLLFLCSPNNPTGNSFSEDSIIKLLNSFNGIVVIDEAYIDFSENKSWLSKLHDFSNLIITQTLSKAYGMAGIRLGICYASKEIIAILNKIKPPYNINNLTQQKAYKQLEDIKNFNMRLLLILKEKERLFKELLEVDFVEKIYPSQANFILLKVDNAVKRYQQLINAGIVVRNRSNQPLCEDTLRITVGTFEENSILINTLKSL